MGFADRHGRASVSPSKPRAFGVCDECGCWYNYRDLVRQTQWAGTAIVWQGTLVCRTCFTKPQEQLRAIRLPPDPIPIHNPRPEVFPVIDMPLGFTQYTMWPGGQPLPYGVVLTDGNGNPILTDQGQEILIEIGSDGVALLAQLAQMTGIPIPGTIQSSNGTIAVQSVSQSCVPAAPTRSYLAIFNPCSIPMWINVGQTASNVAPSLVLGSGTCLFWATAQGGVPPTQSDIEIFSPIAGVPYYAYSAP